MQQILVFVTLTLIIGIVQSQQYRNFEADVTIKSAAMRNGGAVFGKLSYNWDALALKLSVPTKGYSELYKYNTARGLPQSPPVSNPFKDQWAYVQGSTCSCETGGADHTMPILFTGSETDAALAAGYTKSTATVNGVQCTVYTLKDEVAYGGYTGYATKISLSVADGTPVQLVFENTRTLDITNVKAGQTSAADFEEPNGCTCGKPIDIVMVLDRSGSIDQREWADQKAFVQNFANQFQYGPLNANLAIVHFNKIMWTTLTLAEGSTNANVEAAIKSLQCCEDADPNNLSGSCCCCGTSISGGLIHGAKEMAKSTRPDASKVILTLTDGYHNTNPEQVACTKLAIGCIGDLELAVSTVKRIPELAGQNIILYAIGVGADRTFSEEELKVVADNDASRVLTSSSFGELAQKTLEIVAKTCDQNALPCGACCGICVCGKCLPPDVCQAPVDKCLLASIPDDQICCNINPVVCPPSTPCFTYECDSALGNCTGTEEPIPDSTQCLTWACDVNHDPAVFSTVTAGCEPQNECTVNEDCDDKNACTENFCDVTKTPHQCSFKVPINCSVTHPADNCSEVVCSSSTGCVRKPYPENRCDDGNVCTNETCVPFKGCVYITQNCTDNNTCTVDTCDPQNGCRFTLLNCTANYEKVANEQGRTVDEIQGCVLAFCDEGLCKDRWLECPAAVTVTTIVGASLGAAAIAGIIVAAVVAAVLMAGGGAYAYAQGAGGGAVGAAANNPIYVGSNTAGANPLYGAS